MTAEMTNHLRLVTPIMRSVFREEQHYLEREHLAIWWLVKERIPELWQMARDIQQSSINWDNKIIETYSSKYLARISKCSSLLKWRDLISKEETTLLESLPGMVLGLVEIQQKCDLLRVCKERMVLICTEY